MNIGVSDLQHAMVDRIRERLNKRLALNPDTQERVVSMASVVECGVRLLTALVERGRLEMELEDMLVAFEVTRPRVGRPRKKDDDFSDVSDRFDSMGSSTELRFELLKRQDGTREFIFAHVLHLPGMREAINGTANPD